MSKTREKTSLPIATTRLSPNFTKPRRGQASITRLTPHHMAGNATIEVCLGLSKVMTPNSVNGMSMNYAIGTDGRRGLGAEETKEAWTSSNRHNDARAITFEIANNGGAPNWSISDAALNAWVDQAVETAKFYGFKRVFFVEPSAENSRAGGRTADQVSTWLESQRPSDAMLITLHRFFAATACPGPYFEKKLPGMIVEINKRLSSGETVKPTLPDDAKVNNKTDEQLKEEALIKPENFKPYTIRVNTTALNVRRGPGLNHAVATVLRNDKNVYTIVEEASGQGASKWGKLKSGVGWVSLDFVLKV